MTDFFSFYSHHSLIRPVLFYQFSVLPMVICHWWKYFKISIALSYASSQKGRKESKWSRPWMSLIFMAIGSSQSEAKYHTHHQEALLIQKSQPCIWGNHDFVWKTKRNWKRKKNKISVLRCGNNENQILIATPWFIVLLKLFYKVNLFKHFNF